MFFVFFFLGRAAPPTDKERRWPQTELRLQESGLSRRVGAKPSVSKPGLLVSVQPNLPPPVSSRP